MFARVTRPGLVDKMFGSSWCCRTLNLEIETVTRYLCRDQWEFFPGWARLGRDGGTRIRGRALMREGQS